MKETHLSTFRIQDEFDGLSDLNESPDLHIDEVHNRFSTSNSGRLSNVRGSLDQEEPVLAPRTNPILSNDEL